ncbi:YlbF family regulator [Halorussus salinisoli]|uniref:YlbF family regulator n=1 Tax=Halorussus salinisoli TaxID=2558242 RepID=UPI0010C20C84|nr:YlbF family regulator [Halorussus salinisoli]
MSIETEADGEATELTHVEELAGQLGEAIAQTPEYQRFEETKEAVEQNDEAQEKVQEFEQMRQEFMLARQTGEATKEDVQKVREAQQELHSMPVMEEYLQAQEALEEKMETVNKAISEPLAVDFGDQASGCCED